MNKIVDNFDLIKPILNFGEDFQYFIQILQRRKENPEMKVGTKVIKNYFVKSLDDFEFLKYKIHSKCQEYNARAYINVNRFSVRKAGLLTIAELSRKIAADELQNLDNIYTSVASQVSSETKKRWIIDIDEEYMKDKDKIYEIIQGFHYEMNKKLLLDEEEKNTTLIEIPTVSGVHLISHPFNVKGFHDTPNFKEISIHKQNATLLYYKEK